MPIDQDIARTAAAQANKLFGKWMPERWLNLFIDSYDDLEACKEVDRIMNMSEEELAAEVAKDGETMESVAERCRAIFERAIASVDARKLSPELKPPTHQDADGSKAIPAR